MKQNANDQPMFDFDAPAVEIRTRWRCVACGNELLLIMAMKQYMDNMLPRCAKCGGELKAGY